MDARHNAVDVGGHDADVRDTATRLKNPSFLLNDVPEGLNFIAVNGAPTQDHFETIVVFGVVAARDLNARVAKGVGRKIKLWGGGQAHIQHLNAHRHQTANKGSRQNRSTQAPVTTHRHGVAALFHSQGTKSTPQALGHFHMDGARECAANVVCLENGCCHLHMNELP